MRYLVMIRRTGTGYSVDVPDVPGCVATAVTVEHARQMIAEALEIHFDLLRQSGDPIPKPRDHIDFAVDADADEELCTWVDVDMHETIPS